jgi:mono/diheme cytochrome c family protein
VSVASRVARLALLALAVCLAACSGTPPGQAAAPSATVAPADAAEAGRALFRNKGCVTCHLHNRVAGESGLLAVGPDLSAYRNVDVEFLRAWLANPQAIKPDTPMPDLDLTGAEIESLIAFLNEPR